MKRWIACAALSAGLASAQPSPDLGLDFVSVGDAGNPGTKWTDFDGRPLGAVDYEYRIMRTEVNASQWVKFLIAYEPFADDINQGFSTLLFESFDTVRSEAINAPITTPWLFAARFANWMHNERVNEAWAFEDGAYDMATFVDHGPPFGWSGQFEHKPGAKYWIPSESEWLKAAHYDPDRYGPGEGGYWYSQGQQDEDLVSGLPGEPGAQTSAGQFGPLPPPVGSYPEVISAYGLLDTSGGVYELTEDDTSTGRLALRGSRFNDTTWPFSDWLGPSINTVQPDFRGGGIRLASSIPSPPTLLLIVSSTFLYLPRQRRIS